MTGFEAHILAPADKSCRYLFSFGFEQIFAAEGALSRQAELLQDVKDESASGDGDGGS